MRTLITCVLFALALPSFGQTKMDFINCLELIFIHNEFQPAFTNNHSTGGNLIIVSGQTTLNQSTIPILMEIRRSLTQNDFRNFRHYVKVVREEELGPLGIPKYAVLEIIASGNESEITFGLTSNINDESQTYLWHYNLVKIENEWRIAANSLRKQYAVFND